MSDVKYHEHSLGELVRERREEMDLSMRQLGEIIGMSPPFICDIELNRRGITETTARKLAKALGLDEEVVVAKAWDRKMRELFITHKMICPRCNFPRDE